MGKIITFIVIVLTGIAGILFVVNTNTPAIPAITLPSTINGPTPTFSLFPIPSTANTAATPGVNQNVPKGSVPPATPTPRQITASTEATIKTAKGDITLIFYPTETPNTVLNFLSRAMNGFYNNLTFHRVEDWVTQGGDPLGNGTGGNSNMPVEFTDRPFVVGSLGVASRGDGKAQNDAQFFITKKDSPWLDTKYTNFGMVTKGMDVVEKIEIGDKILGIEVK